MYELLKKGASRKYLSYLCLAILAVFLIIKGQDIITFFKTQIILFQTIYGKNLRYWWLIKGLFTTLQITFIAVSIGIIIGLILSLIRVMYEAKYPIAFLNTIANIYITVIRGTPVTVQLFIIYFWVFSSVNLNPVLIAALAFGINSGAYVAEIFRSGISAVDQGQMEAGLALGFTYLQCMRKIILPQAIKYVLPTLFNEVIALIKETAIAGYVGVIDLTRATNDIRTQTYSQHPLFVTAIIYFIIILFLTIGLNKLEMRMKKSDRN